MTATAEIILSRARMVEPVERPKLTAAEILAGARVVASASLVRAGAPVGNQNARKYHSEIGSFRGVVRVGGKWVHVKNLDHIDKTGWERHQGPGTNSMGEAMKSNPLDAKDLATQIGEPNRVLHPYRKGISAKTPATILRLVRAERLARRIEALAVKAGDVVGKKTELIMAAGYADDFSKSNNAYAAEMDGKYPATELSKRLGVPVKFIKEHAPSSGEWHHTSKFYNTTPYYSHDSVKEWLDTPEGKATHDEWKQKQEAVKLSGDKVIEGASVRHLVWGGTRQHPVATETEEQGVHVHQKAGNQMVTITRPDGSSFRKKLDTRGFEIKDKSGKYFYADHVFKNESVPGEAWDAGKHPRVPAGSPGGGQFTEASEPVMAAEWSEEEHPREPAGTPDGGEFMPVGSGISWGAGKGGKHETSGWSQTSESEKAMKISHPEHGEHWLPKRGMKLEGDKLTVTDRGRAILDEKVGGLKQEKASREAAAKVDEEKIAQGESLSIQRHADGGITISGGKIERETDKAVLYTHPDHEDMWLPKSQCKIEGDKATIPGWLADKKIVSKDEHLELEYPVKDFSEKAYRLTISVSRPDGEPESAHIFVPKSLVKYVEATPEDSSGVAGHLIIPRWLKAAKEEEFEGGETGRGHLLF